MTCKNIYTAALALIGEPSDNNGTVDYSARSLMLLPIVFARYARLSDQLTGESLSQEGTFAISSLEDNIPLDSRLYPVCAQTLASMLILDELPELSELLLSRANADAKAIAHEIVTIAATREVYES